MMVLKFISRKNSFIWTEGAEVEDAHFLLSHNWSIKKEVLALYSESELKNLHQSFGHPSVTNLYSLVVLANQDFLRAGKKPATKSTSDAYKIFYTKYQIPKQFMLTVGTSEFRFNHIVQVDTCFWMEDQ